MPMTEKALLRRDGRRDIGAELLQSVREMKRGQTNLVARVEVSPATHARLKSGFSQAQFAQLLGVSVRTLQDWEQGRRQPSGAARTLIAVAERRPKVLLEVFKEISSSQAG